MTHEQYSNPAHFTAINESFQTSDADQHAPNETPKTMSNYGPFENRRSTDHRLSGGWIVQDDSSRFGGSATGRKATQGSATEATQPSAMQDESYSQHRPTKRARVHFYDFAAQARLQQHHERRKRYLQARKRVLQKSIALSARLRRTSSWIQDGLVEISKHQDPKAFARVYSHTEDLVDSCYSHWKYELNELDTIQFANAEGMDAQGQQAFFEKLPAEAQVDLLDLLSSLRSNPQFLIDRLRSLPRSQVSTLTSRPAWQFSDEILKTFSQDSNRSGSQRRRQLQTYSTTLEDYATTFERSSPLSFLLHNLYGYDVSSESFESRLRLYNWSSICAELLRSGSGSYDSLFGQLFESFSATQNWPAKTRIELFLTDVLQRGAFLINDHQMHRGKPGFNPLDTEAARQFFDDAVLELYWTLADCASGCFPTGALALAQAILGKLSSVRHQRGLRTHFFSEWYLAHFLKTAIMFPENENMLLKMHVSKNARDYILAPIYNRFLHKFRNMADLTTEEDEKIRNMIESMIAILDGVPALDPYDSSFTTVEHAESSSELNLNTLVVSAFEIVQLLETLSPQTIHSADSADQVMRALGSAFRDTYSRPTTRFDMLKQELMHLIEPGTSAKDIHPCVESWTEFAINKRGALAALGSFEPATSLVDLMQDQPPSLIQKAALRACSHVNSGDEDSSISTLTSETTLAELFQHQLNRCYAETRTLDAVFWREALAALSQSKKRYAFPENEEDDTLLLSRPFEVLIKSRERAMQRCGVLEDQLGLYEAAYQALRKNVRTFMSGLEELRLKLWYTSQVTHSDAYLEARNVVAALSHMTLPSMQPTTHLHGSYREQLRPSTSRSSRSSIFGEPQNDTMKLLKAPTEHGGPRKLADEQIESILNWLQQFGIDNFCKGEERLHRFCMEIQLVIRSLTRDTMKLSPELWSSELFTRERLAYDVQTFSVSSAPASTRPASVFSDAISATSNLSRPIMRSSDSDVRSIMSDERSSVRRGSRGSVYSVFQRSLLPPDLASSLSSYGRTSSANTTTSEIFSRPSQSVTSYSVYSRTPSILHGSLPNFGPRPATSLKEKKRFQDQLRKGLVSLLLSDLGCLVWSRGCETDSWINEVQLDPSIDARCKKRMTNNALQVPKQKGAPDLLRRNSDTQIASGSMVISNSVDNGIDDGAEDGDMTYLGDLGDVLTSLSKQVDPVGKLRACVDLHAMAIEQLSTMQRSRPPPRNDSTHRRRSLNGPPEDSTTDIAIDLADLSLAQGSMLTDAEIVEHLKQQLARLKPLTIFRDLQFVAVFASAESLEDKAAGKALLNLGMAALEYKKELCSSMVDVAHQIVAADAIKRQLGSERDQPLLKAARYWKVAARESNPVAQRELALLYLMHPEMLEVVTLPLSTSADIFRDEMMWDQQVQGNNNRQALCLAMHWMQLAAANHDEVAQRRLNERNGQGFSIR